jgi:hypothetical protein
VHFVGYFPHKIYIPYKSTETIRIDSKIKKIKVSEKNFNVEDTMNKINE